jgi:hypothetical protein
MYLDNAMSFMQHLRVLKGLRYSSNSTSSGICSMIDRHIYGAACVSDSRNLNV